MKLHIHYQTLTVAPLKFGNGYVISYHTLLGMWLPIHAEIQVKPWCQEGSWVQVTEPTNNCYSKKEYNICVNRVNKFVYLIVLAICNLLLQHAWVIQRK